jgi:hypothetical protein
MTEEELREQEREHQEDLARLRGFRPIDDTFMRVMFRDSKIARLPVKFELQKPRIYGIVTLF